MSNKQSAFQHPFAGAGMTVRYLFPTVSETTERGEAMRLAYEYLTRAKAALAYVPPEPVVERWNEAPVAVRFCLLPPGSIRWSERGWTEVLREARRWGRVRRRGARTNHNRSE